MKLKNKIINYFYFNNYIIKNKLKNQYNIVLNKKIMGIWDWAQSPIPNNYLN